jgi:cholesterol transport system auxiliary component
MKNKTVEYLALCLVILASMAACSKILTKPPVHTTYYALERVQVSGQVTSTLNTNKRLPTLVISLPKAAAGFDTKQMMYTRAPLRLEYFARNAWIDTPAQMLRPLIISAIEKTGAFRAVIDKQGVVAIDLRLESEVIKLVQDFSTKPSHVLFTLRVSIIDSLTHQVIATREFDERVNANSDNPIGGVLAANAAVNLALDKLSVFSQQAADNRDAQK